MTIVDLYETMLTSVMERTGLERASVLAVVDALSDFWGCSLILGGVDQEGDRDAVAEN